MRVRVLRGAAALEELAHQVAERLRGDSRGRLERVEGALGAVDGPAALHLVEHRRLRLARGRAELRRDAHRPRRGPVRLLAAAPARRGLDQAGAEEDADVEVQVAGIDAE